MQKHFIFSAMLFAFCVIPSSVNAQLEVLTSGDVKLSKKLQVVDSIKVENSVRIEKNLNVRKYGTIAKNLTVGKGLKVTENATIGDTLDSNVSLNISHVSQSGSPYYGVKSHIKTWSSMPTSSIYALCGYADAYDTGSANMVQSVAGVYGKALKNSNISSKFCAGVAGMAHIYGGIGVYGGVSSTQMALPTTMPSGYYAGYFDGTVIVNGTLTATNISSISDLRQKENIRKIEPSLADNIQLLKPVSYTLKQDTMWANDKDAKELQGVHYGLIAQEVQKIFPEIVYERGDKLSINYIELIPILIIKIQELSAEVEFLKQEKAEQTYRKASAANVISEQAVLYQNVPNPFTVDTKIAYQLPESTRNASLYIFNMNGLQVAVYPIFSFGEGHVIVSAGSLEAGMYLYSLVADSNVVDTKRMILTK